MTKKTPLFSFKLIFEERAQLKEFTGDTPFWIELSTNHAGKPGFVIKMGEIG